MKKVKLDREIFTEKLGKLMKFVPSKAVIPAYENFMMRVSPEGVTMYATDGAVQCVIKCDCKTIDTFTVCITAKILFKTVSLFRENEVIIKQKVDNKIEVSSGKSKYNITIDCFEEGYPIMEMEACTNEITIRQFFLKLALASSEKFVDEENMNANFTGINIAEIDNKIIATGLNGSLMCRVAVKPISINRWDAVCINTDTSNKVAALMDDKGEVSVIHNGNKISFFTSADDHNGFVVTSTVSNLKFPPTEKVFGRPIEASMEVNAIEFKDAIKRLKIYNTTGMTPSFRIEVGEVDARMTYVDNLTGRDGEEFISINNNANSVGMDKTFNSDFFLQILNSVETNDLVIKLSDSTNKPCLVYPKVNTEEENMFSFLISSMTV